MSAFFCGAEHIAELAKALVAVARRNEAPGDLALVLFDENVRSLCHRYSDDTPELYAKERVATWDEAARPRRVEDALTLSKMIACYEYQSNEPEDWETTEAIRLVRILRDALEPLLPARTERAWLPDGPLQPAGYDAANGWPYDPDRKPEPVRRIPLLVAELPLFRGVS